MLMNVVKNDLYDYENLCIFQYENAYKFSIDSILLAEFIKPKKKDSIVDLCSGLCPVPLILSTKFKNNIYTFEIQKEIFNLATNSVIENNLSNQIFLYNDDILNLGNYFKVCSLDIISCNPPYFKVADNSILNDDLISQYSRHEILMKLEDVFSIAFKYLKDFGSLYIVHRSDRIDEIMLLANKYKLNIKTIIHIGTDNSSVIKSVLIKCVKNSNYGVRSYYVNINGLSTYKNIFKECI